MDPGFHADNDLQYISAVWSGDHGAEREGFPDEFRQ
jgi:hypothetical protein